MKKAPIKFTTTPNSDFNGVEDIEPNELAKNAEKVHIVDVRGLDEYTGELGHIDSSKLIVLNTLPDNLDQLPKDEPIVFVCKAGGRSARAAAFAKENGFEHVYNMKGGMTLWNRLGLPTSNS